MKNIEQWKKNISDFLEAVAYLSLTALMFFSLWKIMPALFDTLTWQGGSAFFASFILLFGAFSLIALIYLFSIWLSHKIIKTLSEILMLFAWRLYKLVALCHRKIA